MKLSWHALLPGGLFWRTFLLISLLLTLSLGTWIVALRSLEVASRAEQLAQHIISIINVTKASLLYSAPQRRGALLADLATNESLHIYPLEPDDRTQGLPNVPLARALQKDLRQHLGMHTRVEGEVNGNQGLWVSFRLDEEDYWVKIERERLEQAPGVEWVFWGSAALLLSLLGSTVIVTLVNQPLARLMRVASQLARGEKPARLPASGLREINGVNESFNRMVDDVMRVEQERALILAGISHDLRTPLTRLNLEIEMAPLPTSTKDAMQTDISQMDAIVGQFLDFARDDQITTGSILDLSEVVRELLSVAERQSMTIISSVQPDITVVGSRADLQRLINNLLENARRYGHAPGEEARIQVNLRQGQHTAVLNIIDSGPGIPEERLGEVKRPFVRGDTARGQANGAGLGLSIVDRIVQRLGGKWAINNHPDGGLVVTIELPASSNLRY